LEQDRNVAAKLIRGADSEQPDDMLLFARAETRILEKLHHENIVEAYEAGLCGEIAYIILEYSEGVALDRLVEKGPLPLADALDIAVQLARALEHAHAAGVLHLDVKPSNVWVARNGRAKLLDFGIGAELERIAPETQSTPSLMYGTPAYMAPEQWRLMLPDARADIWSLGVTVYELLTGDVPFAESGEHAAFVCEAIMSSRLSPCVSGRLNAPVALDEVLRRALANDRVERFQTANALRLALEAVYREATQRAPAPATLVPRLARASRARRRQPAFVA
jgi:serine/threonine-protein kinase